MAEQRCKVCGLEIAWCEWRDWEDNPQGAWMHVPQAYHEARPSSTPDAECSISGHPQHGMAEQNTSKSGIVAVLVNALHDAGIVDTAQIVAAKRVIAAHLWGLMELSGVLKEANPGCSICGHPQHDMMCNRSLWCGSCNCPGEKQAAAWAAAIRPNAEAARESEWRREAQVAPVDQP